MSARDEGQNDATELGRSGGLIRVEPFLKPARQTRDAPGSPTDQGCATVSKTDVTSEATFSWWWIDLLEAMGQTVPDEAWLRFALVLSEELSAPSPCLALIGSCESSSQSILARRGNHDTERPDRGQRDL